MKPIDKHTQLFHFNSETLLSLKKKFHPLEEKRDNVFDLESIQFSFLGYRFIAISETIAFNYNSCIKLYEVLTNRKILNGERELRETNELQINIRIDSQLDKLLVSYESSSRGWSNDQLEKFSDKYAEKLEEYLKSKIKQ